MDCTSEPKVDPSPDEAACERLTDGDAQRAMFSHSAHWGCLRTLTYTIMPIGGRAYVSFTVCIAASVRLRALHTVL